MEISLRLNYDLEVRILLFDNHDSFTWNLAHDLERCDAEINVVVVRSEDLQLTDIASFDAVVLSPGPGLPEDAPKLMEVLETAISAKLPVLGICLGLQAIVKYFGGELENMDEVLHGRVTEMVKCGQVSGSGAFDKVEFPCEVGHYHSWVASEKEGVWPEALTIEARNKQGMIMAICHNSLPITGFQFHPESILTPDGTSMLAGWLISISTR